LITIRAEVNTPQTIKISVIDTGVGMTVEQIQNLFIPDQNKSTEGTNKETGTGLGLVICKEFINLHGGEIDVKSETGNGSDFSFSLPWVH
jgi:signal transduction histidine kinase